MSNYYDDDEFEMRGSPRSSGHREAEDRRESKKRKEANIRKQSENREYENRRFNEQNDDEWDDEEQEFDDREFSYRREWDDEHNDKKFHHPCNCRKCNPPEWKPECHCPECRKNQPPCCEPKVKKCYYPIYVYPPCVSKNYCCPMIHGDKKPCPPKDECEQKPEHKEECKPCPPKDECKHDRDRFDGIDAFAYVYSLSSNVVVVAAGTDVIFTNNGPTQRVTHLVNTSQVVILRSGTYEIYYGVNAISGTGASIGLAVNGVVNPSTVVSIPVTPSETSGKVILELRAGDILTLRNTSIIPITLAIAPSVGAQLTLIRLDELEKNNTPGIM